MLVVIAANACTDDTAAQALKLQSAFEQRGHELKVLDLSIKGKVAALNAAETHCPESIPRIYIDADVRVSPGLVGQIIEKLNADTPLYATGRLVFAPAQSFATRNYGRFWSRLPFLRDGGAGAGVFAVNAAGRTRWKEFPDIISDDTFVRLQFAPDERREVAATFEWPLVEGFSRLVRVRRRQDAGVDEIARLYPHLIENAGHKRVTPSLLARLALQDPLGFLVYASTKLAVRLRADRGVWSRGR